MKEQRRRGRIGGVVRFPRGRLERWVRSREQGTGGARRVRQSGSPATAEPLGSSIGTVRPSTMRVLPRASRHGAALLASVEESVLAGGDADEPEGRLAGEERWPG